MGDSSPKNCRHENRSVCPRLVRPYRILTVVLIVVCAPSLRSMIADLMGWGLCACSVPVLSFSAFGENVKGSSHIRFLEPKEKAKSAEFRT